MRLRKIYIFTLIAFAFAISSCIGNKTAKIQDMQGDTIKLKYSELLSIVEYDNYKIVDVSNPWRMGNILQRYILISHDAPTDHLPSGTIVRVPLKRGISFTSVHCSLISELGSIEKIVGIADTKYIKQEDIKQRISKQLITDVGSSMNPDIEGIIDISPDAILVSPFENNGGYGKISDLGIPIIECADYMESSALGRAEWMRFYGILFGVADKADSLFAIVDSSYCALKEIAHKATNNKSVIMDRKTGSVWYVPGGRSTIGMMLSDANARYPFSDNNKSGSLPLPFETVLEKAGDSDIWLFRYDSKDEITYEKLLSEFDGYSQLHAYKNKQCYGCNVETSFFYELTPFRPDYHLNDIIKIIHDDVKGLDSLRFYKKLL